MITLLLKLKTKSQKNKKKFTKNTEPGEQNFEQEQSVVAVANRVSSCLLVFLEPGSVHIQVTIITIVQISFYLFLFFYIFLHYLPGTLGTPFRF